MSEGAALLRAAVRSEGRVEGSLLMVDRFLNHRVEPALMQAIGRDLADRFAAERPEAIVTAEASGIPPAMSCATHLGIPFIYAKKYLGPGDRHVFSREVMSPTRGTEYRVEVSRRVLEAGLNLLIVDDFLAGGRTAEALGEIAEEAACSVAGFGFAVEKRFSGGRDRLQAHGWRIESLLSIESLEGGTVVFSE